MVMVKNVEKLKSTALIEFAEAPLRFNFFDRLKDDRQTVQQTDSMTFERK